MYHDSEFARDVNLRTAHNLVRQARRQISIGHAEEARALLTCADEFLDRLESPACEILPFPKVPA